ncbi:MAG: hypothetical protein LBL81_00170 [Tannerella sp.]|nr:hypothetical protein [Tannerella sp.]
MAGEAATTTNYYYYVKQGANGNGSSWKDASGNLQAMIDAAYTVGGGQVWVWKGTYLPSQSLSADARDKAFLLKDNVEIYGGFTKEVIPDETGGLAPAFGFGSRSGKSVLSGDLGASSCFHVVVAAGLNKARLDGFTITSGNAEGTGSTELKAYMIAQGCGGGLYVTEPFNGLLLSDLTISGNTAGKGGGIYMEKGSKAQKAVLANMLVCDNSALEQGGGLYVVNASPYLVNMTVTANTAAAGGGISVEANQTSFASPSLLNTLVYGNQAKGNRQMDMSAAGGASWNAVNSLTGVDPKFGAGYVLTAGSPAIDAGETQVYTALGLSVPTTDLGGNSRVSGSSIDLGAFEYAATVNAPSVPKASKVLDAPLQATVGSEGLLIRGLQPGTMLYIYNMSGQLLYQARVSGETQNITSLQGGAVYIVSNEGRRVKTLAE